MTRHAAAKGLQQRALGSAGLAVSAIGYGCMGLEGV